MKLLFDQNISFQLCRSLADLFPDSNHVRLAESASASDRSCVVVRQSQWLYARVP
jgi:predicted nuclease of predicted toxin-antitoxin system